MRYSIFSVQDHYPGDHRTVPGLYEEVMAQAELADRLGYDTFFVAEHHFHEYGVVPNPAVMLAALAQRTRRIRLGSAISILTFHHPLTVAESYAMVDVMSGGRLVLGVGSGYLKHEFEGYAVDAADKRERFDEGLAVVRQALTGERFSFQGKTVSVDQVQINVRPVQQPSPPIVTAILRKDVAYHIGRKGDPIMVVPYASVDRFDQIGELVSEYRRGQAEAGIAAGPDDIYMALHTHVAASEAQVRAQAAGPFDRYVATRLYAKSQTYDDIMRSQLGLFGTVEQVADKMVQLHDMGVEHVMMLQNFGLMPQDQVRESMRLVAEAVMPTVRQTLAARASA